MPSVHVIVVAVAVQVTPSHPTVVLPPTPVHVFAPQAGAVAHEHGSERHDGCTIAQSGAQSPLASEF